MVEDPRLRILIERVHKDNGPCLPVCTCVPRIRSILSELEDYYDGYSYQRGREDERRYQESMLRSKIAAQGDDEAFESALQDLIDIGAITVIDPPQQD